MCSIPGCIRQRCVRFQGAHVRGVFDFMEHTSDLRLIHMGVCKRANKASAQHRRQKIKQSRRKQVYHRCACARCHISRKERVDRKDVRAHQHDRVASRAPKNGGTPHAAQAKLGGSEPPTRWAIVCRWLSPSQSFSVLFLSTRSGVVESTPIAAASSRCAMTSEYRRIGEVKCV
jgi:hypothetical protein